MTEETYIPDWMREKPLEPVHCDSTRCNEGLHSFLKSFRGKRNTGNLSYRNGVCIGCGADLIDWNRLDNRNLDDVEYTVDALKKELIRRRYWARRIDENLLQPVAKMGLVKLREKAEIQIQKHVNKPYEQYTMWDKMQTPWEGNFIAYAQHATATCCKRCIEEWHGIPRNSLLDEEQIKYCVGLIMYYVETRLKSPEPEIIPNH